MIDKAHYLALCEDTQANFDRYLEEASSQVKYWEYSDWKRYDLTPYWFERNLELRAPKTDSEAAVGYGFNDKGELCIIQSRNIQMIECISRSGNELINRRYREGKLDSIEQLTFQAAYPATYVEFIVRGGMSLEQSWHFEENYQYEGDLLKTANRYEYWSVEQQVRHYQCHLSYSEDGFLKEISDQNRKVIYRHFTEEEVMELREELRIRLISESAIVFEAIGKKIDHDRICFIGIYLHDEPDAIVDPIFHPALERIRLKQLEEGDDLWTIWNPGEHPVKYQESIQNEKLIERFRLLLQHWQVYANWWDEAKTFWHEVSQTLNQQNWSNRIPVTDDFVIFAEGSEFDVTKGDLAKNVPRDKLNVLKARGLLD